MDSSVIGTGKSEGYLLIILIKGEQSQSWFQLCGKSSIQIWWLYRCLLIIFPFFLGSDPRICLLAFQFLWLSCFSGKTIIEFFTSSSWKNKQSLYISKSKTPLIYFKQVNFQFCMKQLSSFCLYWFSPFCRKPNSVGFQWVSSRSIIDGQHGMFKFCRQNFVFLLVRDFKHMFQRRTKKIGNNDFTILLKLEPLKL